MSFWIFDVPRLGDHIRVNRGLYFHHGIYIGNNKVVQYGTIKGDGILNKKNVRVMVTSLDAFLRGGMVQVRVYTEEELKYKKKPDEIVRYAINSIGRKDYSLFKNNCEHFCNECVFGTKESEQIEGLFRGLIPRKRK